MLAALLTILKIAGMILLAILAILLTALLLILFVPIRYRAKASYDERPVANATASWLLHLVSFRADYEDTLTYSLRVLGINIFRKRPEGEAVEEISQDEFTEKKPSREAGTEAEESRKDAGPEHVKVSEAEAKREAAREAEEDYEHEVIFEEEMEVSLERSEELLDEREREERRAGEEILREWDKAEREGEKLREESRLRAIRPAMQRFFRAIKNFFVRLRDYIEDRIRFFKVEIWEATLQRKDWLMWLLRDPANVATYHLLWRQLKKLLNHIKPRKVEGDVKFGFDDPYLTGQVLVAISPFYGLYAEHFTVTPVFDENVTEGRVSLKGRVRIFNVAAVIIRMLMDKNFRFLLDKFINS